jgi:hypothetical protein
MQTVTDERRVKIILLSAIFEACLLSVILPMVDRMNVPAPQQTLELIGLNITPT